MPAKTLHLFPIIAVMIQATSVASSQERPIRIDISKFEPANKISNEFLSYNLEMATVIGGNFWRPYKLASSNSNLTDNPKAEKTGMFMRRPPLDLSNQKLRQLTKGLGPANIRISGTWANKVYFQGSADAPEAPPPDGFDGTLQRAQWANVVEFANYVNAKILISFAISPGTRSADGTWTPDQARALIDFTNSLGGKISYAEFFNEPNIASFGGAPSGYTAADYARDHAIFESAIRPEILVAGPSVADSIPLPAGAENTGILDTEPMLTSAPPPQLDIFTYHFYPAVSKRCASFGSSHQVTENDALNPQFYAKSDEVIKRYQSLRDKYAPGKPLWLTETADAYCGGNPWGVSFLEAFRFADSLGRHAQKGVDVIFHNTLIGSEYGLIEEEKFNPTPKYWVSYIWKKIIGNQALKPNSDNSELTIYAQCGKSPKSLVILIVNTKNYDEFVDINHPSNLYSLTSNDINGSNIMLNGRELSIDNLDMPDSLTPYFNESGVVKLPSLSVNFIEVIASSNEICRR